jgi:hypothetical protein
MTAWELTSAAARGVLRRYASAADADDEAVVERYASSCGAISPSRGTGRRAD